MEILGIVAGFLVSGIALFFWYKIHRSVTRGEEFRIWPARKSGLLEEESSAAMETFVAAYRSGNAVLPSAPPLTSPSPAAHAPAPVKPPTNSPATSTAQGEAFLSGAVKVAYLSIKSGLRDHHVFVHVDMEKLPGYGPAGATRATLDLLVCNAAMKPVAGIDMIGADSGPADPGKLSRLRALDVRYLRLSVKSLPKPEAVRALLYRA